MLNLYPIIQIIHLNGVDIQEREELDLFEAHQPDCVMHLAAESHVDRSIDGPSNFIETNIIGTFAIWNPIILVTQFSPKNFRFHHVSTDEVFGSLSSNPKFKFTETSSYDPRSPYSASKASSTIWFGHGMKHMVCQFC